METNRVNQHLVGSKYKDIIPKLSIFEDQGDYGAYVQLKLGDEVLAEESW